MGADIERARITYMTYQGNVIGQSTELISLSARRPHLTVRLFSSWRSLLKPPSSASSSLPYNMQPFAPR